MGRSGDGSDAVMRRTFRVAATAAAMLLAAGCKTGKTPPLAARDPLADSADQVFYHAKSRLTDHGVMKSELHADTGYFFDDNTRIEMRVDTTFFFTATGAPNAVLTSREGTYNTRTGNMEARGDVIVTGVDGRRLTTPQLRYAQAQNQISSDSPFVLTDTTRRQTTGVGFTSDPDMNNVKCLRQCAGTAGVVNLTTSAPDTAHRPASAGAAPSLGAPAASPHRGPPSSRATGTIPPSAGARAAPSAAGPLVTPKSGVPAKPAPQSASPSPPPPAP
jgi:LPS export ABC transporter protein LptC